MIFGPAISRAMGSIAAMPKHIAPVAVYLPDAYGAAAYEAQIAKGAGHKYIKRVPVGTTPTGATRYRYYYEVQHGAGVHNEQHFVEGAAFRHEDGHFHVTADHGDEVTLRHDETGKEHRLTKKALAKKLVEHHGKALDEHKQKVKADLAAVERHGSEKQKKRMRAYARQWGVASGAPASKRDPDSAALEGWQKNDPDAVAHVQRRAQELLPGVRVQDSHDVVAQHVYGGGITGEYRERMERENRIVKPAKKPAPTTTALPKGTRVTLNPVGTDYMRGAKGTVAGDYREDGHVVVDFDDGKSLAVRVKDLEPAKGGGPARAADAGSVKADASSAEPYMTPNGRGGMTRWASKAEYDESVARREAIAAETKATNAAANAAREAAFEAKPGHAIETTDRMSNSGYHRSGKPNWWLRRTDKGPGNFIDIPRVRGDEYLKLKLDLEPGTYTAGAGRGKDGVRHSFTVPASPMKKSAGTPPVIARRHTFGAYLRAYLAIAKGRGPVKYIRRVPTGNPKRPWRYIYSEAGTAHAAQEGERINLRHRGTHDVVEVKGDKAKLRHSETGAERTVSLEALHEEIHGIYGAKAERGAARLAKQLLRAAGPPPAGAFKSPKATWSAYAKRFKEAGVDEGHAKRLVGFLSRREGWEDDAKAVLLSLATGKKRGAQVTASGRQIAQGAENLRAADGAKKVGGAHVVRAVASRLPKGEGDAGQRVEELRAGAAGALGKLEGILDAIQAVGESAPKALLDKAMAAAGSEHIQALNDAAKAYPGLHDLPEVAKLHELRGRLTALQKPADGAAGGKGVAGAYATVYIAGPDGAPMPQAARYRLVEADEVIASHDPTKGFAQRQEYPEGVQERVYHRDKAEQAKVLGNADKLRPDLVVNTNPDAVNGPPVITADGIVLGGNSRAMTLQLVHAKDGEAKKRYVDELRSKAAHFGLAASDVDGMKNPVLVREVQTDDDSKEGLGVLVRRYNEAFTQAMDPRTDQVARARLVTPHMLRDLAMGMDRKSSDGSDKHPTLNAFLGSADATQFVQSIEAAGIIDRRNRSMYIGKDGKLNEDGKTFVERLLVGKIIPHPDTLSDMPPSQINALARSVPHIYRLGAAGRDISAPLMEAVEVSNYMRRYGLSSLDELDNSSMLGDTATDSGMPERPKPTGLARSLLQVITENTGPVQMSAMFRKIAQHAGRNPVGQVDAEGRPEKTTEQVVEDVVNPPKVEQAGLFASQGPRWRGFGALLAKAIQQDMFGQHVRVDTSHKPVQHGLDFGEPTRPKPASANHPGGSGWQAVAGSKHGAYRRRHGSHWEYWYPDKAAHAYPQGGKVKPGAMVRAPDGHLHVVKRVLQHGKTGEMMVGVDTPRGPKEWPVSAVKVHREAHEAGGTLGLDKVPQIQLRAGGYFGRLLRWGALQ